MTDVRKARDAAISRRLRDLDDDRARWMPVLLDELEAIDRAEFADRNGLSDRFAATLANVSEEEVAGAREALKAAEAPAKPAAPRRTRRTAPKGGTA